MKMQVTKTTVNWKKHKHDVYEKFKAKYGSKVAEAFIRFYASRYDRHNRSFIDYNLAFWLMDDYMHVKNVGTRWYGFVGTGGTGKSTLATNVFYFFDPTFELDRASMSVSDFIKYMAKFSTTNAMRAIYMDEPDDSHHILSKQGKNLRRIFGKARQQKLFLGICATDLKDIPTYIFRKLDAIFFLPYLGHAYFFKNRPKKQSYPMQRIRWDYSKLGYQVFYRLSNELGCLKCQTHKAVPFTESEKEVYLTDKAEDYRKDITTFVNASEGVSKLTEREKSIMMLYKNGLTMEQIGTDYNLTKSSISKIIKTAKEKLAAMGQEELTDWKMNTNQKMVQGLRLN